MRDVGQAHVFYIRVKKEFYCDNLLLILLFILPGIPFEVAVSSIMISFVLMGLLFIEAKQGSIFSFYSPVRSSWYPRS